MLVPEREEEAMPGFVANMRAYIGRIRTMRKEIRTRRLLDSLPPHIQADIGWSGSGFPGRRSAVDEYR